MNKSIPIYRGENSPRSTSVLWLHREKFNDTNSPMILSAYNKGKWSTISGSGSGSGSAGFKYEVADELPEASASTVGIMYLVPASTTASSNVYNEFVTVENESVYSWEQVGSTAVDISGKEDKANKVTSLSAQSTDTQYPSAKCVYDIIGNVESLLAAI